MKFTYSGTGDRVFDGPDKSLGVLTGFNMATLKGLKAALKIPMIDDLDMFETSIAYYVLSIRAEDHTLMPWSKWGSLTMRDFKVAPHVVTELDADGDCAECQRPLDAPWHTGVEVPPTGPTVAETDVEDPESGSQNET